MPFSRLRCLAAAEPPTDDATGGDRQGDAEELPGVSAPRRMRDAIDNASPSSSIYNRSATLRALSEMAGADAVLRLRALRCSGDFEQCWQFHLQQERERNHLSLYARGSLPSKVRRLITVLG